MNSAPIYSNDVADRELKLVVRILERSDDFIRLPALVSAFRVATDLEENWATKRVEQILRQLGKAAPVLRWGGDPIVTFDRERYYS